MEKTCPAVWLRCSISIQCAECGSVINVEAENPQPDDLDGTPEIDVECVVCSSAPGVHYHRIPVVLLVGDQVEESTLEEERPDQADGCEPSEVSDHGDL